MAAVITNLGNRGLGTRNLSAGDWVRLKRLHSSRRSLDEQTNNKDIASRMTNTTRYSTPFYKPFTAGSSRIRRTASNYTDYVASQAADYILQRDGQINKNDVCGCVRVTYTFSGSIFNIAISSTVTSQTIAVIAAYIENLLGLPAGSVTNLSIG